MGQSLAAGSCSLNGETCPDQRPCEPGTILRFVLDDQHDGCILSSGQRAFLPGNLFPVILLHDPVYHAGQGSEEGAALPRVNATLEQKSVESWKLPGFPLQGAPTILVVDDETSDRSRLVSMLIAAGCAIETAS